MASITWFLLILVAATSAAPVQDQRQASEKAVPGQVKRADEFILYGNHQNLGRIKKSDPANSLNADDEVNAPPDTDVSSKQSDDVDASSEGTEGNGDSTEIDNGALEDYLLRSYGDYYSDRAKRSAPLTADNMQDVVASKTTSRKRRDLTDAEIAALLEAREYETAAEQEQPPSPEELGDLWRQELVEMYGPNAQQRQEETYDQDAADSRAILQYLYGEDTEEPSYANEVSAELEEEEKADGIEPIYYHGRAGVFVPVKRSFISAVPGVRKRSGGYGSDDNLAYLDDYVERVRNEDEKERLYELALALNAANSK